MAYCIQGNYTIQNCLGVGIDPAGHALDVVGVGTTANTGGVIANFRSVQNAARLYIVDEDGGANAEKPGGILSTTGYGIGIYSTSTNAAIKFYAGGCAAANEVMRICSNGRVGIGTTSPSAKLDVSGADGRIQSRVDSSDGSTINVRPNSGKCGWISYTEDAVADRWGIGIKNGDAKLYFASGNVGVGGGTTRMVLDGSGNMGIGTTSPGDRLTIGGGGIISFFRSTNDRKGCLFADSEGTKLSSDSAGNDPLYLLSPGASGQIRMCVGGNATMTIGASNVGINTTTPSAKLAVEGSATDVENVARFNNQINCTTRIIVRNSNHTAYFGISSTSTADPLATGMCAGAMTLGFGNNFPIQFWNGATPSVKMTITSAGDVGIGTGGPSYKLHVNGTFYAAGSSIKYKEGICNYDTDSCLFMCLKPVTYQYKDEWQHLGRELKSQSQIGLIAEDVAEVMPELAVLVNEDDEKVVRNVDYEKLSVVLLKEVQKLRQEVDELKNNK